MLKTVLGERRQERILRINQNFVSKWRKDKSDNPKSQWKKMEDLRAATLSTTHKARFLLEFDKVFTFEAANESEANEIVTKIIKIREMRSFGI